MLLSAHQVTASPTSYNHWTTCASDLGLAPGHWPRKFHTNLGNGLPLLQARAVHNLAGELVSMIYVQDLGVVTVEIYND